MKRLVLWLSLFGFDEGRSRIEHVAAGSELGYSHDQMATGTRLLKVIVSRRCCLRLFVMASLLVAPIAAHAQESTLDKNVEQMVGSPVEMRKLLRDLQRAVDTHDATAVAALVNYPIRVPATGRTMIIRSKADFVAKYDSIMIPEIADAIKAQRYEDLFVRDQGAMVGSGQVWFAGVCLDKDCKRSVIRIKAIQSVK